MLVVRERNVESIEQAQPISTEKEQLARGHRQQSRCENSKESLVERDIMSLSLDLDGTLRE